MNRQTMMAAAIAAAMMTMTVSLFAAQHDHAAAAKSEPIYGYRMMSDQERNDYRERMRSAGSAEDRQKIRDEHHQQMQARAKERGVTPPERGSHQGPGAGMASGQGMGPGGHGMGPGGGMGAGKGAAKGPGARADCPAGQECPGPGAGPGKGSGKGSGPRPQ